MTSSVTGTTAKPRHHIAMCPFPFTSHVASMLLLTRKIVTSTTHVQISFFTTESSMKAFSPEDKSDNVFLRKVNDGLGGAEAVNPVEAIRRFSETVGESLRKAIEAAEEEVGVKITCLVADALMTFACSEIAEEKAVKWVALWTPSATGLVAHMHTDQLREAVGPEGIEVHKQDSVDQYIQGFPSGISLKDLPHEILGVHYSFPVARIFHLMSLHLTKAVAVAVNSFPSLEPVSMNLLEAALEDKSLCAGPYVLTMSSPLARGADPQGCLAWLDTQAGKPASVVYISFGSAHTPPPEEFTSLAEALTATRVPFLWSLPERFKPYLPLGFEESKIGKVVTWAPQISVLGHPSIGAHLTHCGWNSTMESVVTGVPLICRPLGIADNKLNGRMAVGTTWGIGIELEKMTKVDTTTALERMMFGEEGRKAREKIGSMKRLAEEATVEPHGSSAQNLRKFITITTRNTDYIRHFSSDTMPMCRKKIASAKPSLNCDTLRCRNFLAYIGVANDSIRDTLMSRKFRTHIGVANGTKRDNLGCRK